MIMNTSSAKVSKRGFTLVELLVVIGILAILTAAVVVVLNPAELLKQSRDAQRFSDFSAIQSAVSLYLSTAQSPQFSDGTNNKAFFMVTPPNCFGMTAGVSCAVNASTTIDGTGWVAVNFNELSLVNLSSPLSALPTDPINNASYHYASAFDAADRYYQIDTVLESNKYATRMATDGGSSSTVYEVGNKPGLNL